MDDSDGSQDVHPPAYVQDIMKVLKENEAKMRMLEESNKLMMETIIQLKSSNATTSQAQPTTNGEGNTSNRAVPLVNVNGDNTSGASNLGPNGNVGTNNTVIPPTENLTTTNTPVLSIGTLGVNNTPGAGTSNMTIQPTATQGYVTKEEL